VGHDERLASNLHVEASPRIEVNDSKVDLQAGDRSLYLLEIISMTIRRTH